MRDSLCPEEAGGLWGRRGHRWKGSVGRESRLRTEVAVVGVQGLECSVRLVAAHHVAVPWGARLFGVGS